ncbi:hypothetical protein E5163_14485 [Marinicauda algicola]|uniref:DUF2268 domain-containing protein n=1 Tax=Marinicauda algicola TaxID=2029849 RepID=A0A4S2GXL2_9PROT|nr:DUF5700 domain-containing putative Zn-dependent protease [Marinicauda algicola]TGY87638.1 hypothetical protein E5163_14485 [Marinicauda algicola]
MTRTGMMAALLAGGLGALSPAGTAAAQIDTGGTALFWQTADRLAAGEALSEADWDAVFAHPGYAITEAAAQRRRAIVACMSAVFAPDGDVAATLAGFEGDWQAPVFPRICEHLQAVRARRAEIEAFAASPDMEALLDEAVAAAAAYLPAQTVADLPRPQAYLIVFEPQGLGRDGSIVTDALYTLDKPREENVQFIGHEFHHAYRETLRNVPAAPEAGVLLTQLDRLVHEGVASMIDKAGHIRAGTIPYQYPPEFTVWAAETPARLAAIDAALAELERSEEGYRAAARVVRDHSPSGGHMNGVYMAMAIEDGLGREALIAAQTGPLAFFTAYQAAATALDDGRFRFSEAAMANLQAISRVDP